MKKILQFEDDAAVGDIYGIVFKRSGYEHKHYLKPPEKGEDLIKLVLQEKPDIIISDIIHPNLNGIEMAKILKSDEQTEHIPFVILTNNSMEKEAKEIRVDLYLMLSENTPSEVVDRVNELLIKK